MTKDRKLDLRSSVMECKVCGRHTNNESANFCEYCGNSYKENNKELQNNQYNNIENIKDTVYSDNNNYKQENKDYNKKQGQFTVKAQDKETVSFGNWLLTLLLPVLLLFLPIPFFIIGIIMYIVLLFVWSLDNKTLPSKKNWARAQLIVVLVMIILFIVLTIFMVSLISSGAISLPDIAGLEGFEGFY